MVVTSDYLENDSKKILKYFMHNSYYFEISTFLFKVLLSNRQCILELWYFMSAWGGEGWFEEIRYYISLHIFSGHVA